MKKSLSLIILFLFAFGFVYAGNDSHLRLKDLPSSTSEGKGNHANAPASFLIVQGNEALDYLPADAQIELIGITGDVKLKQLIYSIDGSLPQPYTDPIALAYLSDGQHTLHFYAEDVEGNKETLNEYVFVLDRQAPHLQLEILENAGKKEIKLEAVDDASGVKALMYSLNGNDYKPYTTPLLLNQKEQKALRIRCVDKVNNSIRYRKLQDSQGYALLK